jgi:hypothetical protein
MRDELVKKSIDRLEKPLPPAESAKRSSPSRYEAGESVRAS